MLGGDTARLRGVRRRRLLLIAAGTGNALAAALVNMLLIVPGANPVSGTAYARAVLAEAISTRVGGTSTNVSLRPLAGDTP